MTVRHSHDPRSLGRVGFADLRSFWRSKTASMKGLADIPTDPNPKILQPTLHITPA